MKIPMMVLQKNSRQMSKSTKKKTDKWTEGIS